MPSKTGHRSSGDIGERGEVPYEIDDFRDDYVDRHPSGRTAKKANFVGGKGLGSTHQHLPSSGSGELEVAPTATSKMMDDAGLTSDEDFDRQYDLTPVGASKLPPQKSPPHQRRGSKPSRRSPSYSIDPWEVASPEHADLVGASGGFPLP